MGLEEAEKIAALLERAPLAGFLALTIVAVVVLFWLLLREKNAHQTTIREVVELTSAISGQWERQLDLQDRLISLDARFQAIVAPKPTPRERP
ncbi:MAG: hypothetical protein WAZ94_15310 [Phycisphaerales bacterium]|nr:hypothetical protein [Chloroflexota bacterium]